VGARIDSFLAALLNRPEMEFQGEIAGKRARLNHQHNTLYHFGFWILDFRLAKGCHQRVSQIDLSHPSFKLVLASIKAIV
jgi:hypothetical protein